MKFILSILSICFVSASDVRVMTYNLLNFSDDDNREIRIGSNDYAIDSAGNGTWMNGKIAIVMVYNRELSDAEVQQNYNAHRYRFGR